MRVPKGGGTVATLVSANALEVAVDTAGVYWGNAGAGNSSAIMKANLDGSNPVTLAPANAPGTIVLDDANVYWIDFLGAGNGAIKSVPKAGGNPTTIASGAGYQGLALEASNLYWASLAGPNPWISTIVTARIGGGGPTSLGSASQEAAVGVVTDASHLYWDTQEGDVLSMPIGGGATTRLASGQSSSELAGMFVDGATLYWAGVGVTRAPVTGGTPVTLVSGSQAFEVAVDATSVYFTSSNGLLQISK